MGQPLSLSELSSSWKRRNGVWSPFGSQFGRGAPRHQHPSFGQSPALEGHLENYVKQILQSVGLLSVTHGMDEAVDLRRFRKLHMPCEENVFVKYTPIR